MKQSYFLTFMLTGMLSGLLMAYNPVHAGEPQSCHADFTMTASPTNPLEIHFTDKSTGSIYSWSWNFGDGGTSDWQNPVHIFPVAGIYKVCLTIKATDSSYCTDTHCDTLYAGPDTTKYFDLGGHLFRGALPINNPVSTGDTGIAYLYRVHGGLPEPADTLRFTYLGYFAFPQIAEGDYYIKAELTGGSSQYTGYRPTFYPAAENIEAAEIIHLSDSGFYHADIHLIAGAYGTGDAGSRVTGIQAYPNPAGDMLHLRISNPANAMLGFSLYDLQGRRLLQQELPNKVTADIDLSGLLQGIYFLEVILSQENHPARLKIIRK